MKICKILLIFVSISVFAQLEDTARNKMLELNSLIDQAEEGGLDAVKEKMTIRVAEVYLKYANWDENNVQENVEYFKLVSKYKNNATQLAQDLPDFERSEIVLMLDEAIANIKKLISGEIVRKKIPQIDWSDIIIDGNQIKHKGKPVFLTDYTWKPYIEELNEYFGARDGFFLAPTHLSNSSGSVNNHILKSLDSKSTGTFGSVFLNHSNVPDWTEAEYGPGFKMREDTYTAYDIDNPGAKKMWELLMGATIPKMAGKKYTQLGYMLTNEPHFITTKDGDKKVWATGPVSEFTKDKFKVWLENKHGNITSLNSLWNTNFTSFNNVTIEIPIEVSLQGTPIWYDWQRFNMDRVTEWFGFLQSEVKKNDPQAKTHIKLIPNHWADNKRDQGLDLEALTRQSDIIGNDAGAHNNYMWGAKQEWESRYNFEWREMAMSYDFFKSVSPNKIMYNSETHFLSTVTSRDLYQKPSYARMVYWLSRLHGLNVDQCWFWARREDGSIRNNAGNGYGGSNNQQPRIINEVTATLMDLNSYAEEITEIQNLRKSIRIFDTQTTTINKFGHMDAIFHLYESLFFEGLPLGFATKDIINIENNDDWDVILVHDTEFTTKAELDALQAYLNQGGTVIVDGISLKKDEYGNAHTKVLTAGSGKLIQVGSIQEMKNRALEIAKSKNRYPKINLTETNGIGAKGCHWRAITTKDGRNIISIVNIGKTKANVSLNFRGISGKVVCTNLLNGSTLGGDFDMEPEKVLFLEVKYLNTEETNYNIKTIGESCPNKNNGGLEITAKQIGNYKIIFKGKEIVFTDTVKLSNLSPDKYSLCIENTNLKTEQCYEFVIVASEEIIANTTQSRNQLLVNLEQGTPPYRVYINNKEVINTTKTQFSVPTNPGDTVEITTDTECEGKIIKQLSNVTTAYPNPTKGIFNVAVNSSLEKVVVELYNIHSQLVKKMTSVINSGMVTIDVSDLPQGVYITKVYGNKTIMVKVIKK